MMKEGKKVQCPNGRVGGGGGRRGGMVKGGRSGGDIEKDVNTITTLTPKTFVLKFVYLFSLAEMYSLIVFFLALNQR